MHVTVGCAVTPCRLLLESTETCCLVCFSPSWGGTTLCVPHNGLWFMWMNKSCNRIWPIHWENSCCMRKILPQLQMCVKCQQFRHKTSECKSIHDTCAWCARMHQTTSSKCTTNDRESFKCTNCQEIEHGAADRQCHIFVGKLQQMYVCTPDTKYMFFPINEPKVWAHTNTTDGMPNSYDTMWWNVKETQQSDQWWKGQGRGWLAGGWLGEWTWSNQWWGKGPKMRLWLKQSRCQGTPNSDPFHHAPWSHVVLQCCIYTVHTVDSAMLHYTYIHIMFPCF